MPQTSCDMFHYTGFSKILVEGQAGIESSSHFDVPLAAPNGADRLFVFSGIANVGLAPTNDSVLISGQVLIGLDLDLSDLVILQDGAACAGLAGLDTATQSDTDADTTFAIDCVDVIPSNVTGHLRPVVRCAVRVSGVGGDTVLRRISYQANLQVTIGFEFLVSPANAPIVLFRSSAVVVSGQPWLGRVTIPFPAPPPNGFTFDLKSFDQGVPVPPHITIPPFKQSADITPPMNTSKFSGPPLEKDVPIVASFPQLGGLTSTAILKVLAI